MSSKLLVTERHERRTTFSANIVILTPSSVKTKEVPSEATEAHSITPVDSYDVNEIGTTTFRQIPCIPCRVPSVGRTRWKTWSTVRCIFTNMLLPQSCRFCSEAAEKNCLDCFLCAVNLNSFLNIFVHRWSWNLEMTCKFPLASAEIHLTRFIAACTIGLIRIERFQPGMGLLDVESHYAASIHWIQFYDTHPTVLCRGC